jgi:hypothetical protein
MLLGIDNKNGLAAVMESFANNPALVPRWRFTSFDPKVLLGFDKLATVS